MLEVDGWKDKGKREAKYEYTTAYRRAGRHTEPLAGHTHTHTDTSRNVYFLAIPYIVSWVACPFECGTSQAVRTWDTEPWRMMTLRCLSFEHLRGCLGLMTCFPTQSGLLAWTGAFGSRKE